MNIVMPRVDNARWPPVFASMISGESNEKVVVDASGARFNMTVTKVPALVFSVLIRLYPMNERKRSLVLITE